MFVKFSLPLSIVEFLAVYALALAPWSSLKKTWLRSQPAHTATHILAHTHTHTGCETDKGHFPSTNEQALRHTPTQRGTQRDTHTHIRTATHTNMYTDTRCCCCLLLRVVQTIFNTFAIIVNVCKISSIMCVWESKRGREQAQERARVYYMCVRVFASVCVQSEHSILPVAAFCRSFTTRDQGHRDR